MSWDSEAKKLAIKTIGTVESNMVYDSIYYVDPITVGVVQWYGTRAAKLLNQIRATPGWVGVAPSLETDLVSNPEDSSFWNNRYLTRAEGDSLKIALTSASGVTVQNNQILTDLETYAAVSRQLLLDPDTNTQAFIFFCVMYHQNSMYARQVVNTAGLNPSLERLYTMALNHSWFGKFKTRYLAAKTLILSGDTSGIPDGAVDPSEPDDAGGDGSGDGGTTVATDIAQVMVVGDRLHIVKNDMSTIVCYMAGANTFLPMNKTSGSTDVEENPSNPDPEVPPTGDASATVQAMINFLMANLNAWGYSQGAGRLNPPQSGVGDCSSICYYVYRRFAGIELGANTRLQQNDGRLIWSASSAGQVPPVSILRPGDLIYYRWRGGSGGTYGVVHVEFYAGNGQTIGHGGPDNGPDVGSMAGLSASAASSWVRRIL